LAFIIEIDKLKTVYRRSLVSDKSRNETDAEHSWHFALTALVLAEYAGENGIDVNRVIQMALVHDLVEIYAGDTFAYDTEGYASKEKREREAADRLFSLLPDEQGSAYRALWEEFDSLETPDARFAASIDRLNPLIGNYITDGHAWKQNNVEAKKIYERMLPIKTAAPKLWELVEKIVGEAVGNGWVIE